MRQMAEENAQRSEKTYNMTTRMSLSKKKFVIYYICSTLFKTCVNYQ